jgi:RNA polymerase sigma-70 factor, ECF subfamily
LCARILEKLEAGAKFRNQSRYLCKEQWMKRTQQQTEDDLERRRPILISLAEALLTPAFRGHLDASDLVQQTLMEAHCRIEELSKMDEAPLLAWLYSALKHNVLDAIKHLRTAKRNVARSVRVGDLQNSFVRLEQLLVADDTSPSQVLQRNEDINRMLTALQTLPSKQRMAVILKHLRGHTLKEVSEILKVSESAVAGLLHRGRKQLLFCMKEEHDE